MTAASASLNGTAIHWSEFVTPSVPSSNMRAQAKRMSEESESAAESMTHETWT